MSPAVRTRWFQPILAAFSMILALGATAGPSDAAPLEGKRVALVIGNSAYRHVAQLPNPAHDAEAVGDLLQAAGFSTVFVRRNLNVTELRGAVRQFADVAR